MPDKQLFFNYNMQFNVNDFQLNGIQLIFYMDPIDIRFNAFMTMTSNTSPPLKVNFSYWCCELNRSVAVYHANAEQDEDDEPWDVRATTLLQRFPIAFDLPRQ